MRLLHEVLDEQLADVPAAVPIYDEIDTSDPRHEVRTDRETDSESLWQEPLEQERGPVFLNDILLDHRVGEPRRALAAQEQMQWALAQLSTIDQGRRRAFTLHLLDGRTPNEIAMIQGRSPESVREDVHAVQRLLQHWLDGETERLETRSAHHTGTT